MTKEQLQKLHYYDFEPKLESFREEIISGLNKNPKEIHCKFFYDEVGSQLFSQICELPEYYPTRTEIGILIAKGDAISKHIGDQSMIIEYGSGGSRKIRLLLNSLNQPRAYISIDISKEHLFASVNQLAQDYPNLEIVAVCADYTQPLEIPCLSGEEQGKRVIFFPGSTIGNFNYDEAKKFLTNAVQTLSHGGMLIGVDLKKEINILNDAYNDSAQITAAFNLNLLTRINRELAGNFDLDQFAHKAFYNEAKGRIEMHLVSLKDQTVVIDGLPFHFAVNETIHTENSYKYTIAEFQELARSAGFTPISVWTDERSLFSVHYLEC